MLLKTLKGLSFLHLGKVLKKSLKNFIQKLFIKIYIDSVRLMNDSLHSLVDNLAIFAIQSVKNEWNVKIVKNMKIVRMMTLHGAKYYQKLSDYCENMWIR